MASTTSGKRLCSLPAVSCSRTSLNVVGAGPWRGGAYELAAAQPDDLGGDGVEARGVVGLDDQGDDLLVQVEVVAGLREGGAELGGEARTLAGGAEWVVAEGTARARRFPSAEGDDGEVDVARGEGGSVAGRATG